MFANALQRIGSIKSIVGEEKNDDSEDETFLEPSNTSFVESNDEVESSTSPQNRFFADSPYYDAFVEKEIHTAESLCADLKYIGSETESLSMASDMLLKSLDSLSLLCRQCSAAAEIQNGSTNQPKGELGPEIAMLQALGKTLEEISSQHRFLFDVISTSLGFNLMELSVKQTGVINKLKEERKEADIQTRQSEQEIYNYLNGNNSVATTNNNSTDKSQNNITYSLTKYSSRRWSLNSPKQGSHEVQRRIVTEETTAELKRFQLIRSLVDANYERRLALTQCNGEVLEAMQKCFKGCSEKVVSLAPHVEKNQTKCLQFQNIKQPLWKEREQLLIQTLTTMKQAGDINKGNEDILSKLSSDDDDIWNLPQKLATVSKFRRPTPRGVLMEGWLYQKCSTIMPLQSSWLKRWFILKSSGIYCMESSTEGKSEKKNKPSTKFKVKLFDVVLCTVRAIPKGPMGRFCFELINSRNKSIILQARGPKELKLWLDRIRSAVGSQLASDNPVIEEEGADTVGALRRMSSEIHSTVVDRTSSLCWDRDNTSTIFDIDESITSSETDEDGGDSKIQLMKANPICADCSAVAPDWVSLNLGILVCLECSGVHRSLGCHVSKVRSLTLDTLSHAEATLLLSLGNERVNKIWEPGIKPENKALKVTTFSRDRKAREDWIRSKYVKKEFTVRSTSNNNKMNAESLEAKSSRDLFAASERGDVVGMATAIAHGGNVNWENNDDAESGHCCSALRISVKRAMEGKANALACTELLLQNGAKADD